MKSIIKVSPYVFEDHLIIAFDKKWLQIFSEVPYFEVTIDKNNRLVLVGPKVRRSGDVVSE